MWLLFVLSVLPALILMLYIRHKDKVEKEPIGMLIGLFLLGAATILPAVLMECGGEAVLEEIFNGESTIRNLLDNFLVVALSEELCKFAVLRLRTWKNPNFNFTFDAVVYAVTVSLGFATLENILYVTGNGTIGIAVMRGILSVPGHAIDAVFMGWFYGLAKRQECLGDLSGKRKNICLSLLFPILTHGFYDFCLTEGSDLFIIIFFVFEIVVTVFAIRKVRELSRFDSPLLPVGMPFAGYCAQYQTPPFEQYRNNPYAQPYGYQQYPGQGYQQPQYQQPNTYQQYLGQGYQQPQYQQPNTYQQYPGQGYQQPQYQQQNGYQQYPGQGYQQPQYQQPNTYQQYPGQGYQQPQYQQPNTYQQPSAQQEQSSFEQDW